MKNQQFIYFIACLVLVAACSTNKKSNYTMVESTEKATNMRANLIDGSWEANYIMNTPKAFDELYSKAKPTVTFKSSENKVSGLTGCNNFTGTFKMDGNKISFAEGMAVTRKMCPDMTGEKTFLETLKKVNSYSVTENGNTLNLIMGDMAVMRLSRK